MVETTAAKCIEKVLEGCDWLSDCIFMVETTAMRAVKFIYTLL